MVDIASLLLETQTGDDLQHFATSRDMAAREIQARNIKPDDDHNKSKVTDKDDRPKQPPEAEGQDTANASQSLRRLRNIDTESFPPLPFGCQNFQHFVRLTRDQVDSSEPRDAEWEPQPSSPQPVTAAFTRQLRRYLFSHAIDPRSASDWPPQIDIRLAS